MKRRIHVDISRLRELAKTHSGLEIAEIMGVSKDVIYARMREYDIKPKSECDVYKILDDINTEQYTISELAGMCGVTYKSMHAKLLRNGIPYKGMTQASMDRAKYYRRDDAYNPIAIQTMKNIQARSKLIKKEAEAREKGMHYADLQKAETLRMYGRVEI